MCYCEFLSEWMLCWNDCENCEVLLEVLAECGEEYFY